MGLMGIGWGYTEFYTRKKTANMGLTTVTTAILDLISTQESFLGIILDIGRSNWALY